MGLCDHTFIIVYISIPCSYSSIYIYSSIIQGEFQAQKEAVWAITNLTAGGTVPQILYALEMGALKPLCDLLVVNDTKTILVILDAISNMLNVSHTHSDDTIKCLD